MRCFLGCFPLKNSPSEAKRLGFFFVCGCVLERERERERESRHCGPSGFRIS
jgi:hypothetical protein